MAALTLTPSESKELSNIIANLYQFRTGGMRGRYRLIEMAGVENILADVDMDGSAPDVAWDIVRRLAKYGNLDEHYHALGALLSHVLTISDLPQDQAKAAARLIVKYSLVGEPTYIAELRSKYQIDDTIARQPDHTAVPPIAPPAFDTEPTFEPSGKTEAALEQIITSRDNFLDIVLLTGAVYSAPAVCLIEVPSGTAMGTGFLIGPNLLLTNQHVIKKQEWLVGAAAHFNYRKDANGATPVGKRYEFDPDFYVSSPAEQLDYALVRLKQAPLQHLVKPDPQLPGANDAADSPFDLALIGRHRGYLALSEDLIHEGERINIIQHPSGDPLKVVLTQNRVVEDMTATRVQYLADTDDGSSGSPVFNQKWEVVALHHSGGPYPPPPPGGPQPSKRQLFRVNEGIPIRAILADLRAKGKDNELPDR